MTAQGSAGARGPAASIAAADQAAASGNLDAARSMLAQLAQADGSDAALWLRLAAVCRAMGDYVQALDATHRALKVNPLDFTGLLLRAGLLERVNPDAAPEAWAQAVAQRPDGELPPQLEAIARQGEARASAWQAEQQARLRAAAAAAEHQASADERARIERFRTNAVRQTRPYHSEPTHFHFPGLREYEFHPRSAFPWLATLEAATAEISAELKSLLAEQRAELVPYVQYDEHSPLGQWRELNHNADWSAIHLLQNGQRIEAHAAACPATLAVLAQCGQPDVPGRSPNAMFSLLAPNTTIPPHVGVNNTRLVCHLPLIVPEGCWFRVGADKRFWTVGEAMVFDDTIEHEASNPSDELRVVLIFDLWHPDLTDVEREAVTAMLATSSGGESGL